MPLVIFDGPEAAGKSTLLDALVTEWGIPNKMRGWGPRKSWLEYCQALFDDTEACKDDPTLLVVWSRCWASRTVYNSLLSQGQSVPATVTKELEDIVIRAGGLLVFVQSPVSVLQSRRLERLESGFDKPDHPLDPAKELGEFQKYMRNRKWTSFQGTGDVDTNVRQIINQLVLKNPECRMYTRSESKLETVG